MGTRLCAGPAPDLHDFFTCVLTCKFLLGYIATVRQRLCFNFIELDKHPWIVDVKNMVNISTCVPLLDNDVRFVLLAFMNLRDA